MNAAPWAARRLHLIGIGGAGMSGLAIVAQALGATVSGSDRSDSAYVTRLREHALAPAIGHDAANVPADAEVVVSTAIAPDNPELAAARARGQRVLHRGELLAEVTRLRRSIVVAGTHGKTTTASMIAHALVEAGSDPPYLIGGELRSTGTNAAWGSGDWIVVEADESDRSFLELAPGLAVVTNVELDHHATYRSLRELEIAFGDFALRAGRTLAWERVHSLHPDETYGIGAGDVQAREVELDGLRSRFTVDGVPVELQVPGEHNVLNALAALGACRFAGVALAEAAAALRSFSGARRRFDPHGRTASGAFVYDDYAHHPTEVRATLEAVRALDPRRVIACFQPHLYSRTERLARAFGEALALADAIVVLDVYAARERAEDHPGVSGLTIARTAADAAGGRHVYWTPTQADAARLLPRILTDGDVLLTLGAGDIDRLAVALTR
jgi:UDP-N-acetylmuramate--alanine ligase